MADYSPMQDPWYGPSGNGPSREGSGGSVDLSAVESRLSTLEARPLVNLTPLEGQVADVETRTLLVEQNLEDNVSPAVTSWLAFQPRGLAHINNTVPTYLGSVPANTEGAYVLFEVENGAVAVSVEDGVEDGGIY